MSIDYYYGIIKLQGKINAFVCRENVFVLKSLRQMRGEE